MDLFSFLRLKKEIKKTDGMTHADRTITDGLLIQKMIQLDESVPVTEKGSITLTNSLVYPFNNSVASVSLQKPQNNSEYLVVAEVTQASGNPGEIIITDKLTNGFKIQYTGSAKAVIVKYSIIGGVIK